MTNDGIAAVQTQLAGVMTVTQQLTVTMLQANTSSTLLEKSVRVLSLLESIKSDLDLMSIAEKRPTNQQ